MNIFILKQAAVSEYWVDINLYRPLGQTGDSLLIIQ